MKKMFSTNLLCADDDGQTSLQSFSGILRPGRPFLSGDTDGASRGKIELAGGFSSLCPDTVFPLSPALQLNTDLTFLPESALQAIAEAELARFNSINFHSYDVDIDMRVCVLSTQSAQLELFLETYGGLLEVEPLLLNNYHPDFSTVTEIEINKQSEDYEISFTERSPVNLELCTYCAECGAICPERCISTSLQVDFDRCTFCKECEKVCSTNALDMYGVEEKKMRIPTIIVLDGVNVDLPEDRSGIYEEKQLPFFFSTLFSSNVEEVVCHNNSTCQYSGRLGIGCSRCVGSCPHGAITQDESGVSVDSLLCEECGNCIAVCPTGSMQYARFNDAAWLKYLSVAKIAVGTSVIIGTEEDLHSLWWHKRGEKYDNVLFLEYPNVEALSGFHLLLLFGLGVNSVALLHDGSLPESSPVLHQVEMSNHIIASLFESSYAVIVHPLECDEFFKSGDQHPLSQFFNEFTFDNRRVKVAEVLDFLVAASGRAIASNGVLKGFGYIECDAEKCTHCMACLGECSMQSLGADAKSHSLTYSAKECVGCGLCARVCPENALTLVSEFVIDGHYFERKTVAHADPAVCKACGKIFGTRKSLDRVMQILSAREPVNREHFEYCDNCRVVKLFEEEQ